MVGQAKGWLHSASLRRYTRALPSSLALALPPSFLQFQSTAPPQPYHKPWPTSRALSGLQFLRSGPTRQMMTPSCRARSLPARRKTAGVRRKLSIPGVDRENTLAQTHRRLVLAGESKGFRVLFGTGYRRLNFRTIMDTVLPQWRQWSWKHRKATTTQFMTSRICPLGVTMTG